MRIVADTRQTTRWKSHLDAWQASGLTQAAYCRQHELVYCQFTYWKQKLTQSATPPTQPERSAFVPVEIMTAQAPTALTLHLPNGITLGGIGEDNCHLARDLAKALL